MRVRVVEIIDHGVRGTLIKFTSMFGSGKALWRGANSPIVSTAYDVEFDVNKTLEWGIHIFPTEMTEYLVAEDGESLILQGKAEAVGEDGVLALRIGENIILLDTKGEALKVGSFVRVVVDNVAVYDSNL